MHTPCDTIDSRLQVVTTLFNPQRYKSRWKLHERFEKHVRDAGADLTTVEVAFGERHHVSPHITARVQGHRDVVSLTRRTDSELWLKENALNLGIAALPPDWKYVAWVDADVMFARPNWVTETVHQLQHYAVVQMFGDAFDLDPNHEPFQRHKGFAWSYRHGAQKPTPGSYYYGGFRGSDGINYWHPGFAWAARRDAFDHLGGLMDFCILGAADHHMAKALVGEVHESVHPNMHPNYLALLDTWQARAEQYIRRNVGYVSGTLLHYWHGKKKDRRYSSRWEILVQNQYDPALDLKRDWQQLWQLTERNYQLRDDIREYFKARNEDSIDLDAGERRM